MTSRGKIESSNAASYIAHAAVKIAVEVMLPSIDVALFFVSIEYINVVVASSDNASDQLMCRDLNESCIVSAG